MTPERRALYMCAAHCQGGHSDAGATAAEVLGVPFPLTMGDLVKAARSEGENPALIWPWLLSPSFRPEDYFTVPEIKVANGLAALGIKP